MDNENGYKFNVGQKVKVKEKEKILAILDDFNQQDGYLFMDQMWRYCGKSYRVIKTVKNVFDEKGVKIYKVKASAYILKNIICDGKVDGEENICDHSCYFIWHQDWLQAE